MKIDSVKFLEVAELISTIPVNAEEKVEVTIGRANGVVFRLVAIGRTLAKKEDCFDVQDLHECIVDA